MSKRVDTSGLNTELIIGQTDRSNREAKPDPTLPVVPEETAQPSPEAVPETVSAAEPEPAREVKEPPKRKRGQAAGYKETFLKRNEMKVGDNILCLHTVSNTDNASGKSETDTMFGKGSCLCRDNSKVPALHFCKPREACF